MRATRAALVALLQSACTAPTSPPTAADPVSSSYQAQLEAVLEQGEKLLDAAEFDLAQQAIEQARQLAADQADRLGMARAELLLAKALNASGARDSSFEIAERLERTFADLEAHRWQARTLELLATVREGNLERKIADLDTAEALYTQLDDGLGQARVDAGRSLVMVQAGKLESSVRFAQRALAVLETAGQPAQILRALSAQAWALHQLDRLPEARAAYDRVLDLSLEHQLLRHVGFAFCNRAEVRWELGEPQPAVADLERAIGEFEQARARIAGTPQARSQFLATQVAAYDRLIRLLADLSRGQEGFAIAERFRARSFLELLEQPASGKERPRAADERRLLAALGRAHLALVAAESGAQRATARQHLDRQQRNLERRRSQTARSHPAELVAVTPPTSASVSASLNPDEALIAYWLADDRILAWSITAQQTRLTQIPVPRELLERRIEAYLDPLHSPSRATDDALLGRETEHLALGHELYNWLVAGLPAPVRAAQTWIVVPDGRLHYLPFEALVESCQPTTATTATSGEILHSAYAECRYPGLEKSIIYSPSAGVFLALRQRHQQRSPTAPNSHTLLAMAPSFSHPVASAAVLRGGFPPPPPLAHAETEVRQVATTFASSEIWLGRRAAENRFKQLSGSYRFLHLATHGLVNDQLPLSSGLLLHPGGGDDGLLQTSEVLDLELRAELVTLSACRSGRGDLRRGQGLVGLSQAFLAAGAAAVVVSLWDVDDRSTPFLMSAFYRQIASGSSHAEALRAARRELFQRRAPTRIALRQRQISYAHPRFWSSFVLVGAPAGT